jgi:hypothetical protein
MLIRPFLLGVTREIYKATLGVRTSLISQCNYIINLPLREKRGVYKIDRRTFFCTNRRKLRPVLLRTLNWGAASPPFKNGDGGDFLEALLGVLTNLSKLYITEEIQERTLDIGVLCRSAKYVGTSDYYRVIKHEYIGTHIMHCLVKGTLSRQPWFVFCVLCPAAGVWRNC